MYLKELKAEIEKLGAGDFGHIMTWISNEEAARRRNQPLVEQTILDVVTSLQEEGVLEPPRAAVEADTLELKDVPVWVNPGVDHSKMYRPNAIVQHKGTPYISNHQGLNHWEPGAPGIDSRIWAVYTFPKAVEVEGSTDDPTPTTKVWAAGQAYKKDEEVRYNNDTYLILQDHTSADHWRPDAVASLYKKLG